MVAAKSLVDPTPYIHAVMPDVELWHGRPAPAPVAEHGLSARATGGDEP
jgi:hypothetical protein